MIPMRFPSRAIAAPALVGLLALALAACAGPAPSAAPSSMPPSASSGAVPTPIATPAPDLTPVPGATAEPGGEPQGGGTTVIGWGTILDRVPDGFPVFPGAEPTEVADGPSSGAWFVNRSVDDVAAWYRTALEERGFTTMDLSSPLEDGSRVLDTVSDLPECRIQTTFRPADGSTMIIVFYGAGCAGGEG